LVGSGSKKKSQNVPCPSLGSRGAGVKGLKGASNGKFGDQANNCQRWE